MSTRDDTQRQRPRQHSQEDSMQLPQPSQELPQASEEETEASEEETETPLESSANLKTTGLDENDVDYSTHHRNNLPQHLKIKRDEAEKMKRDIARQWSALSDDKKIEWWNKFEHLLEGEINMEGAFFKTPLSEMEEYYENAWKDSKNHQRGGLGKCHRKESAIIFALDYCFEAYNKGNALYFFKFTESVTATEKFKYSGKDPYLKNKDIGIAYQEHIAHLYRSNRTPSICSKTNYNTGRRFMPHELDNYSVDVYGLFDGDPGAFYFEYIMTYVGRIFFQDYTCVNRSYTGVIRESADPDSGKSYAKDRQRHGCAVLILKDVKNMNSVAFNARFSQYDRAKGGNATFGSIDLVTCPLTASQKRRLKRTRGDGAAGEDLEEDEGESYTSRDYRWNCMFDVLTKYADENEWKVGEANWVNPDKCTSEEYQFCPNPIATGEKRDSHDREPYLYIWYMHQIGLKQRNGQIPFVPALRRKRLQNLGASMSKQLKEQVWEKVQERGKQSSEESRRGTQFDRRGGGMSFLKGRMN